MVLSGAGVAAWLGPWSARPGAAQGVASKPVVPGSGCLLGMLSNKAGLTAAQSWAADVATLGVTPYFQMSYYALPAPVPIAAMAASLPRPPALEIVLFGRADAAINAGTYDGYLTSVANGLAALPYPVFLRWDIEMNITSYGYEPTGGAGTGGPSFVKAWQRVWSLFNAAGASNVAFVWCPNTNSPFDPHSWRPFYPGDAYVDWIGVDGYNWGTSDFPVPSTWQTAYQVFHVFVEDWKTNFGGVGGAAKPLMIGETNCYEGGGSKSWWYTDLAGYVRMNGIKCVGIYNTNESTSRIDWRWDSDAAATEAMVEIANDPYFGGQSTIGRRFSAEVMADAPYAYWKFGETAGPIADSSGHLFSGSSIGKTTRGCPIKWQGAGYGFSYYESGYADLGTVGDFGSAMSGGFTTEFLYKDGRGGNQKSILGTLNTGLTTGLFVGTNQDKSGARAGYTHFWSRDDAGVEHYTDVNVDIYDGYWHHVVWVYSPGGAGAVYVDGQAVKPTLTASGGTGATANFGHHLYVGARDNRGTADEASVGVVSNLALYRSQLSARRVAAHYQALGSRDDAAGQAAS